MQNSRFSSTEKIELFTKWPKHLPVEHQYITFPRSSIVFGKVKIDQEEKSKINKKIKKAVKVNTEG